MLYAGLVPIKALASRERFCAWAMGMVTFPLLCFWISVVTVSATMIVKNAYDGIADGQKAVIVWIMGAAGTVGFTDVVVRGIRGTFDWYGNAGTVFTAAGLLVIFAVYRVKRRHDERLERAREQT
mgnify:CR=1 FL=1